MQIEDFIKANFSETEYKKAIKFIKTHNERCFDKFHDVSGALLIYEFIPTCIGCSLNIRCSCGDGLTINDFDILEE